MDFNKSKMKNINAKLELEPNFPRVATPQSSEWITYIISYAYNPFSAPWGVARARASPWASVRNKQLLDMLPSVTEVRVAKCEPMWVKLTYYYYYFKLLNLFRQQ